MALIIFLLALPLAAYAAEDHANHGSAAASTDQDSSKDMNGINNDMQMDGTGQDQMDHDIRAENESGEKVHSQPDSSSVQASGGADHSSGGGHETSGIEQTSKDSGIEPYKKEIVGGFAGINALIIAAAAFLKRNGQGV